MTSVADGSKAAKLERRRLRFGSIGEAIAEAERLVTAEREGRLRRAGNWSLGTALNHCATWAEFGFNGYPEAVKAPWLVRVILRMMKGKILNQGMMTGVKIGKVQGGTIGCEACESDAGLERFKQALTRLERECPLVVNPVFGRLSHQEWVKLNLRHCELHLGFQVPQ